MPRTRDPSLDAAIATATLELLSEESFAAITVEAVAARAGVGKPAIYRRFADKVALVLSVIEAALPPLEPVDLADTRAELWAAMQSGFPPDAPGYVCMIGGLIAERRRNPELIEAFRERILNPRRKLVCALIERGQRRGDIRIDLDPETAVDWLAGSLLARAFAGIDTGPRWRERAFATWWKNLEERNDR
jgi:AcrR family transcriptional regulator